METIKPTNYPCATIYKIPKSEIEKIDLALCNQPSETLESFYKRQSPKPDLLCNGGFYALSTGETVFTYKDNGKIVSMDASLLEGIGITKDGDIELSKYSDKYHDFISAYPVFMRDGRTVSSSISGELNYKARRTIFGFDEANIYLIFIESPGYNYTVIKNLLTDQAIKNAINLDGGGSTRLLVSGKRVTNQVYSRPVDNVVAIYLKKTQTLYRVQTGAFSSKANAEKYQAQICALDDTIGAGYKNAYIRLIDGLYKVQVGAFSKIENASKVVNDLKNKGINSFITTK